MASDKCANCGKEGGNMKKCERCTVVTYCNRVCQKCLRFPIGNDTAYLPCCGAQICGACMSLASAGAAAGFKCPFCREGDLTNWNIFVSRMEKRVKEGKGDACHMLATFYDQGKAGLAQDSKKAHGLWTQAAELGDRNGHFNLYMSYSTYYKERGVEKDVTKAKHHLEKAAIMGDAGSRCQLGAIESQWGNLDRAKKHWMISAAAGCDSCMKGAIETGYKKGHVTEEEYQETLRAYRDSVEETKSLERDAFRAYQRQTNPSYGQFWPGSRDAASERAKFR